jgi:DNA-3-methyladenine glycosylase I
VLRKRDTFRKAFRNFDPKRAAHLGEKDIARLLENPGIIRSRAKIEATIQGARIYLDMQQSGVKFSDFAWSFVDGRPIQNRGPLPVTTPLAGTISKELKARGFKFVGPTIVYAWMQAVGLVNDHAQDCFRRGPCARVRRPAS